MPLTFAHPLAIIPFRKFKIPFSALVIGSFTPDFNYLFLTEYKMGHTLLGQFYFCLPVGLLALFIFHTFIKKPVLSLLPDSHRVVLTSIKEVNYLSSKVFPYVILGLLIGSFSHYLWDSFTHFYGFAVNAMPVLQKRTPIAGMRFYKILQHLSTVTGAVVLAVLYYKWYKSNRSVAKNIVSESNRHKYWITALIFLVPIAITLAKIAQYERGFFFFRSYRIFIDFMMRYFLPPLALVIAIFCIFWVTYSFIKSRSVKFKATDNL